MALADWSAELRLLTDLMWMGNPIKQEVGESNL